MTAFKMQMVVLLAVLLAAKAVHGHVQYPWGIPGHSGVAEMDDSLANPCKLSETLSLLCEEHILGLHRWDHLRNMVLDLWNNLTMRQS